jgi:predicted RNA methylase
MSARSPRPSNPANVVADIGAGAGVMALLACRVAAARVYAIEGGGMTGMVRRIAFPWPDRRE